VRQRAHENQTLVPPLPPLYPSPATQPLELAAGVLQVGYGLDGRTVPVGRFSRCPIASTHDAGGGGVLANGASQGVEKQNVSAF